MRHPIPPGTRDILPDEMRELRELQATLTEVFESRGYGQVATPTLEYDEVLSQGEGRGGAAAYRFFDERGELLALRSDMTIPIARLAASRYADAEPPLRFSYVGNAYRVVRPQRAQVRQFMHAGVELLGAGAPDGTAEVIEVLSAALDAVGLDRAVIGLGDADLYRQLLAELGVDDEARERILDRLAMHDLVGLEVEVDTVEGLDPAGRETLLRLPGPSRRRRDPRPGPRARRRRGRARRPAPAGDLRRARRARGRRPHPARPEPAARPRLLHGRDPRGLRPGPGPHPRRRRPLRRPAGPVRRPDARGGLRPLPRAHPPRPDGGGADRRGADGEVSS